MEEKKTSGKTLVLIVCVALLAAVLFGAAWWISTHGQTKEPPDDVTQYVDWGDDVGGRQAYSGEEIAAGALGDKVVLNSRTYEEGFLQDTRQFVKVMKITDVTDGAAQAVLCEGSEITVEEGIYLFNAYIQNDNPGTVSENTRVGFGVPTSHGMCLRVSGWITADNSEAKELWHEITLMCDRQFHLEYVYGSGLLWRKGFEDGGRLPLPNAIVTKVSSENGTPVGWESLNGELPGGEEYLVVAQIAVKVIYDEKSE